MGGHISYVSSELHGGVDSLLSWPVYRGRSRSFTRGKSRIAQLIKLVDRRVLLLCCSP